MNLFKFQKKRGISNICFKGGGVLGCAFVGVDRAFSEHGIWPQIKRYIGSSAGAIFASCAACRIPYEQMSRIILATEFRLFRDSPDGIIGEVYRLYKHMGLYKGDYFRDWFRGILSQSIGDPDITFSQVYTRFGTDLTITTTNLTMSSVEYLNKVSAPDMKICDAVRKSMSIPALFVPVIDHGNVYVDGGCADDFPIDYFGCTNETVGVGLENAVGTPKITNILELFGALINTEMAVIEKLRTPPHDKDKIIIIPTFGIDYRNFEITKEEIQRLIDSGYKQTIEWIDSKN